MGAACFPVDICCLLGELGELGELEKLEELEELEELVNTPPPLFLEVLHLLLHIFNLAQKGVHQPHLQLLL
jgi:hypothetical protein